MSEETLGVLRGLATLFAMLAFMGVCAWAYSRKRRRRFESAAQLPLEEDRS